MDVAVADMAESDDPRPGNRRASAEAARMKSGTAWTGTAMSSVLIARSLRLDDTWRIATLCAAPLPATPRRR